jgi:ubiquinone/menaquinone biosynthesis C-methylase UbiE
VQSDLAFRLMALEYRLRDLFRPPEWILRQVGVRPGMAVLDFGCGPGSFSLAAADLVGSEGRVYAVDTHPLAISLVRRAAKRRGINHLEAIHGDRLPRVPDGSVDIALLYDVLHEIREPAPTLGEIRRVLKRDGLLSVTDHHLEEASLLGKVTGDGPFRLVRGRKGTFQFEPAKGTGTEA